MSWQAYQYYRFRKARSNRYNGSIQYLRFPTEPGLVSVFIKASEQNQDFSKDLVSSLLEQTYHQIEIIISIRDIEISNRLFSYLPKEGKEKIKLFLMDRQAGEDRAHYPSPRGEFATWLKPEDRLQPDSIEKMVAALQSRSDVDLVYFGNKETINPLTSHFLVRSHFMWILGVNLEPDDPQRYFPYWQQACMVFNLKSYDLSDSNHYTSEYLLDQLATDCSEKDRIQGDFCRDSFLSPWVCFLHENRLSPKSSRLLDRLKNDIIKAGNILYKGTDHTYEEFPRLWFPTVCILALEDSKSARSIVPDVSQNALKVLLNLSQTEMPETVSPEWDICFNIGNPSKGTPLLGKTFQGWIACENIESLLNLLDIRIHAHGCRKNLSAISNRDQPRLKASVVISTYRRAKALENALRSIARQTFSKEAFEVIVVNNDPSDDHVQMLCNDVRSELFGDFPDHLRLILCPLPGLSPARNAGISESRGEIVCFLDDDAVAHENWLEQIWQTYSEHPQAGVIGGHIILDYPRPRPKILKEGLERFWSQFITDYDRYTEVQSYMEFPWGCNWSARKEVLFSIGGFRNQYGRQKHDFSGGEEIIAAIFAQKLGYTVAVLPTAIVEHRPENYRFTFKYLNNTITSQIIIHYRMKRDLYLPKAISMAGNIKGIGRFSKNLVSVFRLSKEQRGALFLEYFCYVNAWFRLFFEQMGDAFARFLYRE